MAQGNQEERLQKLFVGGLPRSTDDETVKNYFENYGELTDCIVIRDQEKKSRGFGYVTFSDYRCTFKILEEKKEKGHTIDGKSVEVKRAIPRDDSNASSHAKTTKIFIGGIKKEAEEKDVREEVEKVLEGSGSIVSIDLIREKETGEFRGFGFIELDSEDSVDTLCCVKKINIRGKGAEVKKAEPKNKEGGGGGRGRGGHGGRGGRGGGGQYGNMGRGGGGFGGGFDNTYSTGHQNMFGAGDASSFGAAGGYGPYGAAMANYSGYSGGYDNYGAMGSMYTQTSNFGPQNTGFGGGRGAGRYKPY